MLETLSFWKENSWIWMPKPPPSVLWYSDFWSSLWIGASNRVSRSKAQKFKANKVLSHESLQSRVSVKGAPFRLLRLFRWILRKAPPLINKWEFAHLDLLWGGRCVAIQNLWAPFFNLVRVKESRSKNVYYGEYYWASIDHLAIRFGWR